MEADARDLEAQESEWRYYKRTALMIAATDGHLDLAKLLRTNGADVNRQGGNYHNDWDSPPPTSGNRREDVRAAALIMRPRPICSRARSMQWASGYSSLHEAAILCGADCARRECECGDYGVGEGGAEPRAFHLHPKFPRVLGKSDQLDGGADVNARVDLDNPSGSRAGRSPLDTVALHYMSRRAAKLRDAGGYCYVQTSSLCAYPPVVTAVTLAVKR